MKNLVRGHNKQWTVQSRNMIMCYDASIEYQRRSIWQLSDNENLNCSASLKRGISLQEVKSLKSLSYFWSEHKMNVSMTQHDSINVSLSRLRITISNMIKYVSHIRPFSNKVWKAGGDHCSLVSYSFVWSSNELHLSYLNIYSYCI